MERQARRQSRPANWYFEGLFITERGYKTDAWFTAPSKEVLEDEYLKKRGWKVVKYSLELPPLIKEMIQGAKRKSVEDICQGEP